ncbi:MAG: hypothetical protein H8D22_07110 [Candidatus Cloacimonetes bacterium]|nr:hypothetical protein [Candidatus Cloacimonadota bacterium]
MSTERAEAIELIGLLSEKKLKIIIDFIKYLKDKEEWEATNELLDSKTISAIEEGKKQINNGNFVEFENIS